MSKIGQISLKDIHVGVFAGEGEAYENVTQIPGALSAKITVKEGSTTFYSDDIAAETVNTLESVEIEIETQGLSLEERALLLGETVVKGAIAASVNDMAARPYIGLAFRSQKSNGEWRYCSIPKIKFTPVEEDYATKGEKVEMQSTKLTGIALPLETSGVYKVTADSAAVGIDKNWLNTFLTTIPQTTSSEA